MSLTDHITTVLGLFSQKGGFNETMRKQKQESNHNDDF